MDQIPRLSVEELDAFNRGTIIERERIGRFYDKLGPTEAKVMDYLATNMNRVIDAVNRNNTRIESINGLLTEQQKQVDENVRDIRNINGELALLGLRTADLADEKTIPNLRRDVDANKAKILELENRFIDEVSTLSAKLLSLERSFNDSGIMGIRSGLADLSERLRKTELAITRNLLSRVAKLEGDINSLGNLKSKLGEEDIRKIETMIHEETRRVIELLKADIDEKVSKIELDELNRRFAQLSNDVETGKANDTSFNEFMSKLTSLTTRLDERVKLVEDPTIENAYVRQNDMNKYLTREAYDANDKVIHTETEMLKRTLNTNSESIDAISKLANRHDGQLHALEADTVKSEQFATWRDELSSRLIKSLADTVNSEQLEKWQKQMSTEITESRASVDGRIDSLKSTVGSLSEQLSQTEANAAKIKDW